MSHNLEIALQQIDAGNRFAIPELEELIAEDAIWDMSRSRGPYQGVYQGDEEIRGLFLSLVEAWEVMRFELLSSYERENWLAMEIQGYLRGRGSGVELEVHGARAYEFRDGKIARFVMFQDIDDAKAFVEAQP